MATHYLVSVRKQIEIKKNEFPYIHGRNELYEGQKCLNLNTQFIVKYEHVHINRHRGYGPQR